MKKILIIFAFITGAFGIAKAETNLSDGKTCDSWIKVTSECGEVFYLCADNYSNLKKLTDAACYFSDIKCN